MFHVKHGDQTAQLQALAADGGHVLSAEQAERLLAHRDLVLEANKELNLTAIVDPADSLRLHILDSLTAVPALSQAVEGPIVDLGSGAGYPGIPLSIVTNRAVILLESRKKRAAFLESARLALALEGVSVMPLRAEEAALTELAHTAGAVTARAVASLPALVELAAPLLTNGGVLVAMKGKLDESERDRGDRCAAVCGLVCADVATITLPAGGETRTILTYMKVSSPQVVLPRRPGKAQREPLF